MVDHPIVICDSMNLFVRSYSACPDMSPNGYQIGGTLGFLRSVRRICTEIQPSELYLVWEGGGSSRRRALFSEYKENRRPEKLNRFYQDDIPDSDDNRQHQLVTLIKLVKNLPVKQLYVPDCEGDDVVAYLCRGPFRGQDKIIASSDKDMYQLIDDTTQVYSFHKKIRILPEDILEEFRISARNFALAKAVCGDPSDNIPGVEGIGFKTLSKKFPILGTDNDINIQDLMDYASSHAKESIIYRRVLENRDLIHRNWKLVYLDTSSLSPDQANRIDTQLGTSPPSGNKFGLIKGLVAEGIGDFDTEGLFYSLGCLNVR